MGREDSVVLIMVVVIGLCGGDNDSLEPLDHTATDEPRYDHPDWEPMIRSQPLTILHVGQDNIPGRVHGKLLLDTGPILGPASSRQVLGALKAHVQGALLGTHNSAPPKHVP